MGFQFNHVGGGTKTRRPIALEMVYDGSCHEPQCQLADESNDNQFQEISLEALQDHIADENDALEQEATFSGNDIIVRIRYEFCANLTIIDTPGVHSTPHRIMCLLSCFLVAGLKTHSDTLQLILLILGLLTKRH